MWDVHQYYGLTKEGGRDDVFEEQEAFVDQVVGEVLPDSLSLIGSTFDEVHDLVDLQHRQNDCVQQQEDEVFD